MVTSPVYITLLAGKARTSLYVCIAQMNIHYNLCSCLPLPLHSLAPISPSEHPEGRKEVRKGDSIRGNVADQGYYYGITDHAE